MSKDSAKKFSEDVNRIFKGWRSRLGMTQEDMASVLNMSRQTYVHRETGKADFTMIEFFLLSNLTGIEPYKLLMELDSSKYVSQKHQYKLMLNRIKEILNQNNIC